MALLAQGARDRSGVEPAGANEDLPMQDIGRKVLVPAAIDTGAAV
jgi:hypothetical protein